MVSFCLMIRTTMPSMEPSVPTGSAIMWPASYTRFGEMRRGGGDDMGVFSKISNEMFSNAFVVQFQLWKGRYKNKLEAFIMCCVSFFLQILPHISIWFHAFRIQFQQYFACHGTFIPRILCITWKFVSTILRMTWKFRLRNTLHDKEISFEENSA